MRKQKLRLSILLFIFLSGFSITSAQFLSVRINSGIDYFNMTRLKDLQSNLKIFWPGMEATDSFPAYYNYQIQTLYIFSKDFSGGIYANYVSTGGRLDYQDYSGEIKYDQKISRLSFGILFEYNFFKIYNFSFTLGTKASYQKSELISEKFLRIYNDDYVQTAKYHSTGFGLEPDISAGYSYLIFLLRIEAGYQVSFPGEFLTDQNVKLFTGNSGKNGAEPQWDGFKLSLTFGVNI